MSSNSICTKPERRRLGAAALLLCALTACFSVHAAPAVSAVNAAGPVADAAPWRATLPQAQPVGGGDLTFFGLRIYRATLWSASRPFDAMQPFALQLSYYRSISRQRLVDTSIDEIRRLARTPIPADTQARWKTLLASAFVDVNEGDELTGVYHPGRGMQLYDRQRMLADIDDDALARAFFDIWLNPDSRDQKLRKRLMGGQS
jgi:hypothetical protein